MIKLSNPLCDKKTTHMKKSFHIFLLFFCNRFFLALEVLYKRNCTTKGAAQAIITVEKIKFNKCAIIFMVWYR